MYITVNNMFLYNYVFLGVFLNYVFPTHAMTCSRAIINNSHPFQLCVSDQLCLLTCCSNLYIIRIAQIGLSKLNRVSVSYKFEYRGRNMGLGRRMGTRHIRTLKVIERFKYQICNSIYN